MASAGRASAPPEVSKPAFLADWDDVTFLNWGYDPAVLRPHLPPGLAVDTFDGMAWVSLVPLHVGNAHVPWSPTMGPLSNYSQTNLRTYVTGPDGTPGVFFFSMDVSQPLLIIGRLTFGAPYNISFMSLTRNGDEIEYTSVRRWGGPGCSSDVKVKVGRPVNASDDARLMRFITERWWFFSMYRAALSQAPIVHPPWQLTQANLISCKQTMMIAAGIPAPASDPVVFYGGNVSTRMGGIQKS
jgi:uncharacterized protein